MPATTVRDSLQWFGHLSLCHGVRRASLRSGMQWEPVPFRGLRKLPGLMQRAHVQAALPQRPTMPERLRRAKL